MQSTVSEQLVDSFELFLFDRATQIPLIITEFHTINNVGLSGSDMKKDTKNRGVMKRWPVLNAALPSSPMLR